VQALLTEDDIDNVELIGTAVHVQYSNGTWEQLPPVFASDADLQTWVRQQAARAPGDERRFDRGSPAVSLRLPDGSRMFAVTEVAASTSVSIRRHRFQQTSLADLCLSLGTLSPAMRDLCDALVRARFNLVIGGGMNTGKTTLLRALAAAIPPWERLVTVESAFELGLHEDPRHANTVALQARAANLEGVGEIRLAEQTDWTKQMNASRVIVGEVRGPEVVPMIDAMSLGCDGSMATVHASGSEEALHRLQLYAARAGDRLPFNISAALIGMAVNVVIHLAFTADGRRVVSSIREVTGADGNTVTSNEIYRPGPDGRGLYTVPPRERTIRALRAVGFDPARLDADRHRWSS